MKVNKHSEKGLISSNRGFTLVELLGVIIILSLLMVIVLPRIVNSVKSNSKKTDEVTEKIIYDAAKLYMDNNKANYPDVEGNIYCITVKTLTDSNLLKAPVTVGEEDISNTKEIEASYNKGYEYEIKNIGECKELKKGETNPPTILKVTVNDTETGARIIVSATDKESGIGGYSFDGGLSFQSKNYIDVTENGTYNIQVKDNVGNVSKTTQDVKLLYKEGTLNGAYPEIYKGLTPVKYNGTNWVVTNQREEWYNYSKQEWANAVILKDGVTKEAGNTVNVSSDITAMFVWIPRYEYKISGTYGKGGSSVTSPGEIEVNFISNKTTTATSGYRIHPAFTFGSEKLNGIWVGKFETTGTVSSPTILPSNKAIIYQVVSKEFEAAQKINTLYLKNSSVDTHMSKNSEWGAVAYLSQSKYGKYGLDKSEIYINNCTNFITGVAGNSVSEAGSTSTCTSNTYATTKGIKASTTGNIYGVYDMNGGVWEYVMGYLTTAYGSGTWGANSSSNSAAFTAAPDAKYYDNYSTTTITTACSKGICYGHSLSETSGWYGDYAEFFTTKKPWMLRGGYNNRNTTSGIFAYGCDPGSDDNVKGGDGFRIIISKTS